MIISNLLKTIVPIFLFWINIISPANALEFDIVGNGGNCTGCEWISAMGQIELDDAAKFEKFLKTADWEIKPFRHHNVIMFHSPGGSLSGGIKLGKKIRELGFSVGIGKSIPYPDSAFHELEDGTCISACAYAFLGGKYRYLENTIGLNEKKEKSCLGFHQFFDRGAVNGPGNDQANGASLTTQQTTQIISGIVVEYLNEIGAPLDIYTFASKFTGSEYGCLNEDAKLKSKVDNSDFGYSDAKLLPFGKGLVAEVRSDDDGRTMRLYCMKGDQFLMAFFLPGDMEKDYKSLLADEKNLSGLKFSASEKTSIPRLELVQLLPKSSKTAIVFNIEKRFISSAFEAGEIDTGKSDSGRAQQSWFDAFNFDIKGSGKIPRLIAKNCI